MSAVAKVTALRGGGVSLAAAAEAFLATPRTANPNTHRAYTSAIDRVTALLGRDRPLAGVTDTEIGTALTELWGRCAPATWNRNRAAITSWLIWCQTKKRWAAPSVPADAERRKENADETRAVAKTTIHRLLSRRDIPLREKTLWRMLYETAARDAEILALNVENLDLEHRRAPVRSKGGATEWGVLGPRHRPPAAPATPAPGRQHAHARPAVPVRTPPGPRPPSGGRRHLPAHRPRPPRLRPRPRPAGEVRRAEFAREVARICPCRLAGALRWGAMTDAAPRQELAATPGHRSPISTRRRFVHRRAWTSSP